MTESRRRTKGRAEAKPTTTPKKEVTGYQFSPRIYNNPKSFDFMSLKIRMATFKVITVKHPDFIFSNRLVDRVARITQ